MTIGEQFEAHFREIFHVENVRVHYARKVDYKTPNEMERMPKTKRQIVGAPREGTLRFKIAEQLKAAPEGLTTHELRTACGVKSNVMAGMLWTMDQEYREIEPCGFRKSGPKTARVYRWIAK